MKLLAYLKTNESISIDKQKEKINLFCKINDYIITEFVIFDEIFLYESFLNTKIDINGFIFFKLDYFFTTPLKTLNFTSQLKKINKILLTVDEKINTSTDFGNFILNTSVGICEYKKDFVFKDRQELLKILNDLGVESLKDKLESDIKKYSN